MTPDEIDIFPPGVGLTEEWSESSNLVRPAELDWLEQHGTELKRTHMREWVAIGPNGWVAAGTAVRAVRDAAKARGLTKPLLVFVEPEELCRDGHEGNH